MAKLYLSSQNPHPQWSDPWRRELHPFELGVAGRRIKASQNYQRGNFERTIELLETCLDARDGDPHDWNLIGASYLQIGNRAKARETMEKGLEEFPQDPSLNMNLARIYLEENQDASSPLLEKAKDMLSLLIQRSPDRWEPYDFRRSIYQIQGELEKSFFYHDPASKLAPANQRCHWKKTACFWTWDEPRNWKTCLPISPVSSEPHRFFCTFKRNCWTKEVRLTPHATF